jgi:hypothetical protein
LFAFSEPCAGWSGQVRPTAILLPADGAELDSEVAASWQTVVANASDGAA